MQPVSRTILFIYGTRPEAIKMAPLIKEFKRYPEYFRVLVCLTGQHREMLDQVNRFFEIEADYDLHLMKANQTLFDVTIGCLEGLKGVLEKAIPDLVFVQGDTTTVLAGALASFYRKIAVAHLEAGLRSGDMYSPFPEEINRRLASQMASYHFAPTEVAKANLEMEGIRKNVHVVGNTVIDALMLGLELLKGEGEKRQEREFLFIPPKSKVILVTGHRRESFGKGFEDICEALKQIANSYNDVQIVYPVHLNPNVQEPVRRILRGIKNVHLLEPLDYPKMLWILRRSHLVLTDSGGIQEEAPALGKPVLVMREVTERVEGIKAGTARLIGTTQDSIVRNVQELLDDEQAWVAMSKAVNPYGDGRTSKRIVDLFLSERAARVS